MVKERMDLLELLRKGGMDAGQSHLDKYKTISSKMWSFFSEGVT